MCHFVKHFVKIIFISVLVWSMALPVVAMANDNPKEVLGTWNGVLDVQGTKLTVVFHVKLSEKGELKSTMDSPDQGAQGIPVDTTTYKEGKLILQMVSIDGKFEGLLKDDGKVLEGKWSQLGSSLPLILKKDAVKEK